MVGRPTLVAQAEIRAWLRLADGEASWDAWNILFAADALPPATLPLGSSRLGADAAADELRAPTHPRASGCARDRRRSSSPRDSSMSAANSSTNRGQLVAPRHRSSRWCDFPAAARRVSSRSQDQRRRLARGSPAPDDPGRRDRAARDHLRRAGRPARQSIAHTSRRDVSSGRLHRAERTGEAAPLRVARAGRALECESLSLPDPESEGCARPARTEACRRARAAHAASSDQAHAQRRRASCRREEDYEDASKRSGVGPSRSRSLLSARAGASSLRAPCASRHQEPGQSSSCGPRMGVSEA